MTTTKKGPAKKKKRTYTGYLTIFWLLFFTGLLGTFLFILGASNGLIGKLPEVQDLENPNINVASKIWSSDGKLLDKFETEKRFPVTYDELPDHLVKALLAKEDIRYYEHTGVDFVALMRAISRLGKNGGGSTITQQLAKQLYTGTRGGSTLNKIRQKILEWITATQLEKRYTKEEILTMYFNKFDFIYGANGIEMAAKTYFNKTTKDLTLLESATLVAMFENPVYNNPKRNPKKSREIRDVVLKQMVKYNFLSDTKYYEIIKQETPLNFKRIRRNLKERHSAYFKFSLKKELKKWIEEYKKETGKEIDLYRDGLQIHLTLDSRMQKYGEQAMKKHLKGMQRLFFSEHRYRKKAPFYDIGEKTIERIMTRAMKRTTRYKTMTANGKTEEEIREAFNTPTRLEIFTWNGIIDTLMKPMDSIRYHKHILNAGLMSMDPRNGAIKAWIGGIDWRYFQYDHVKQGKRQVGSTFKPIVYATAINQMNFTPCHQISNAKFCVKGWCPSNAGYPYGGTKSLREGLAKSINVISARLISQTTPAPVIQLARDLGITNKINHDLTIALGSSDLSVYEMVGAYSTFVNGGIYVKPEMIWRIDDKNGETLRTFDPETREVLNEDIAYTMVDLLRGVVKIGTARKLGSKYGIHGDIGGKTGTTNQNSDGWFMGITPNLVTGIWVGAEDRSAHFKYSSRGQGSVIAMPIWAYYMRSVYAAGKHGVRRSDKFSKPEGIEDRWDCGSLRGFHTYQDYTGGSSKTTSSSSTKQNRTTAARTITTNPKKKPTINEQLDVQDEIDFDQ